MGIAKQREIEEWGRIDANRGVAEEIMVRAGLLHRCGVCREVVDKEMMIHSGTDLTSAYKIASAMFRDGDELVGGYDRQDVLDTIKAIAGDCAVECQCVRRKKD